MNWQPLKQGEAQLGCFLSMGSAVTAEMIGRAGFDFVVIDLEHGIGNEKDVLGQLQALAASGTGAIVRVECHDRQRVHRILDLGAHGIMFPRVNNAEEARRAVEAMRYPPDGVRGVATLIRASGYGSDFPGYQAASKEALLGVLQIETPEGVAHVEEIAAVDGADVLFIGPYDLTQGMGIFRQFDHPKFVDALTRTAAAATRYGRALGILLSSPGDYARYRDLGFRFITCGSDLGLLAGGARELSQTLRTARGA
ncbi:MAG: 2-dehydro-3-deoxyglucarate aldolase [Acidobacteriia bacterium]|nr:2-dehydro-3-deoxyglucarate aldolase [Terriglobia bacterium]